MDLLSQIREIQQRLVGIEKGIASLDKRLSRIESDFVIPPDEAEVQQEPAPQPREIFTETTVEQATLVPVEILVEATPKEQTEEKPFVPTPPPAPAREPSPEPVYEPPAPVPRIYPQESFVPIESLLKGWLRKIHMLPPSGEGGTEAQMVTWWASRIGTLLAVICGVFFGVYVSQRTPPWVKLTELVGASVGITFLGLWFENKYKQLGSVLFGGGLALIYFCAFAAYVVPPVKVIHNQTTAALIQFAAVILLIVCARWKDQQMIGTMAVLAGYVACFFSFVQGLHIFALTFSLLLGGSAVWFYIFRQWVVPFALGVPCAYLIHGLVWLFGHRSRDYGFDLFLGYNLAFLILFGAADYVAMVRGHLMCERGRRILQILNTTAGILVGYAITKIFFRDTLDVFYFSTGAVLLAGSVIYYQKRVTDILMSAYFLKGTTLITLGLIATFGGYGRWVSLAIQSFILLNSAKRTRLKSMHFAMVATWLVSLGSFALYVRDCGYLSNPSTVCSRDGLLSVCYLLFSAYLFSLQARWLRPVEEGSDLPLRDEFNAMYGCLVGGLSILVLFSFFPAQHQPLAAMGLAVATALIAFPGRHWTPLVAASIPFCMAHFRFWNMHAAGLSLQFLWLNAGILLGLTLTVQIILALRNLSKAEALPPLLLLLWFFTFMRFVSFTDALYVDGAFCASNCLVCITYLLISTSVLTWLTKRLSDLDSEMSARYDQSIPQLMKAAWLLVGVVSTYMAHCLFRHTQYEPAAMALLAAVVASLSLAQKHPFPLLAGLLPVLCANARFILLCHGMSPGEIWLSCLVTVALSIGLTVALDFSQKRYWPKGVEFCCLFNRFLHALWLFTLQSCFYEAFPLGGYMASTVMTAIAAAGLSLMPRLESLGSVSFMPLIYVFYGIFRACLVHGLPLPFGENDVFLWLALGAGFGYACACSSIRSIRDRVYHDTDLMGREFLIALLTFLIGLVCLGGIFGWEDFMFSLGVAAIAVSLLSRWTGFRLALPLANLYILVAHLSFYWLMAFGLTQSAGFLWRTVGVAIFTVLYPIVAQRMRPIWNEQVDRLIQWVHSSASIVMLYALFLSRTGNLAFYTTVFWGVSALAMLIIGIADLKRPFRIVGLVGLAVCIPRMFLVDIHSTLYRIAAFGVLSVVVLGVALLYSKYRARLQ